jgi:hypothetical protein
VFGREKKNRRGNETSACAGQIMVKREKLRFRHELTLHGSGAGFNKKIQQNFFAVVVIGNESQCL